MTAANLTAASLETFKTYAEDADNWSDCPWVSSGNVTCTQAMRGNISDLVKKGLVEVNDYEGRGMARDMYITFTDEGRTLAADEFGIEIDGY